MLAAGVAYSILTTRSINDNYDHLAAAIIAFSGYVHSVMTHSDLIPNRMATFYCTETVHIAVADLGWEGAQSPLATNFFSISCSCWENLIKSYHGAPLRVGTPTIPCENPGSATAQSQIQDRNLSPAM